MPTLSICTYASNPKILELPLKEVILSTLPIADELIIINSDEIANNEEDNGEVFDILEDLFFNELYYKKYLENKIKIFNIPFPKRLRKNCYVIQRTNALMQATCDYVLLLDGDEVLFEEDYDKILKAMELGYDAYNFKVLHFFRDFEHIATSSWWYQRRPYLFKNNLGIFDGYRSWLENGELKTEYTSDLTTWDYKPVMDFAKNTSIRIAHLGYIRSDECMLRKYNEMETWFHDDNKSQKGKWEWDMSFTEKYFGPYPKFLEDKVDYHNLCNPNYYTFTKYKDLHEQNCPLCKGNFEVLSDNYGGGSHYWILKCNNCNKKYQYGTYDFKLYDIK